jgi:UDP-N-acetylmuramoylalanine--D-glutamate ligase
VLKYDLVGNYKGKRIAILGWGINGSDVFNFLSGSGAEISILDRNPGLLIDGKVKEQANIVLGDNYLEGLDKYDIIFRAPAVYRYSPEIVAAEKRGVVVTSAIKVFFELCKGMIIGVTGTKGKGTTCTLIYEILKESGKNVFLAGNIGKPVLELLPSLDEKSVVVLELSSFQLIDLERSPHVAVVLNITLDHMDWHRDEEEYIKAKKNIVRYQSEDDYSVVNSDYQKSMNFASEGKSHKLFFSRYKRVRGCYAKDGKLILNIGEVVNLGDLSNLLLRGRHNWENVCASCCASFIAGADLDSIKKVVFSFKGLEHRLELVREVGGIKFYNDSFSTNPQTTMAAVASFEEPITLILGGSDKGLSYDELSQEIVKVGRVRNVILMGKISDIIFESLLKAGYRGKVIETGVSGMREIVKTSVKVTPKGGVVLLSPATASFDMFSDYKDRGNSFKREVMLLKI